MVGFHFLWVESFCFKREVEGLETDYKAWNSQVFRNVDYNLKTLESEISSLDFKAELVGLSEEEVKLRKDKFVDLWVALKAKESVLRQKSRVQWLKD